MYVKNAWYVAAWSHEVTSVPTSRTICELPVVVFRGQDGVAVALADRCAHRGFPLSAGRVVENTIECGYHGFQYNCAGSCVQIPGQVRIPSKVKVHGYPLVEQDGWVWIWTGDIALADASRIPDTHWMNDPEWAAVTHTYRFECNHSLIHDNLLDLTHEQFIHGTTVGDDYIVEHPITVEVDGSTVTVDRLMPAVSAPPLYASTMTLTGLHDRFHTTEFRLPSHHTLHSGITGVGRPREEGYLIKVLNAITPIDATTSWYYYCFARNFAIDNVAATEELRVGLAVVLDEDAEALRQQQLRLASRPSGEIDILVAHDAGIARARRMMAQMLADESQTPANS
jgi:phenylpropionate dioxygenase-like ring-hydroxylating dioxygenase large terminal subunit